MARAEATEGLEQALAREPRLVLLAFVHDGCEPCRELRPELDMLAQVAGEVCRVEVVDAAVEWRIAERYDVSSFPTLVFLKSGIELRRVRGGALPATTRTLLERISAAG